jgi:hypothetical protein
MSLEVELKQFEDNRLGWLADHEGQFVLIKDGEVSFHDTDEEAFVYAIGKYGTQDVFIREVLARDRIEDSLSLLYGLVNVQ